MGESIYGDRELDVAVGLAFGFRWHAWEDASGKFILPPSGSPFWGLAAGFDPGPTIEPSALPPLALEDRPLLADWYRYLPRFSTSPAAYAGLLEEMEQRGLWSRIQTPRILGRDYSAGFSRHGLLSTRGDMEFNAREKTLGEAVCQAALAALRKEA